MVLFLVKVFIWDKAITTFVVLQTILSALAGLLSLQDPWSVDVLTILTGVCYTLLLCYVFNAANQANSREEDAINKPHRPIPSGKISEYTARVCRNTSMALLVVCGYLNSYELLDVAIVYVLAMLLQYSTDTTRWFVCKDFYTAVISVCIDVAGWVLSGATLTRPVLCFFLINGVVTFAVVHTQDYRDIDGDMKAKRRTLPVLLGREGCRIYTTCVACVASLLYALFPLLIPGLNYVPFVIAHGIIIVPVLLRKWRVMIYACGVLNVAVRISFVMYNVHN